VKKGDLVKVVDLDGSAFTDEEEEKFQRFVGKIGRITGINNNCMTGNTAADPLFNVQFGRDSFSFWHEELRKIGDGP